MHLINDFLIFICVENCIWTSTNHIENKCLKCKPMNCINENEIATQPSLQLISNFKSSCQILFFVTIDIYNQPWTDFTLIEVQQVSKKIASLSGRWVWPVTSRNFSDVCKRPHPQIGNLSVIFASSSVALDFRLCLPSFYQQMT